jgi:hypothetical protein
MTDKEAAALYRTDRDAWLAWKAKQAAEAERQRKAVEAAWLAAQP